MKKGIFGNVKALISFMVFAALFIAVLSQFNWDIIEMFTWCAEKIWEGILRIADWFINMPGFRSLFRQ